MTLKEPPALLCCAQKGSRVPFTDLNEGVCKGMDDIEMAAFHFQEMKGVLRSAL
jgi:hypothetical protein